MRLMSVANTLSPGPISSIVKDTARYGISVTVHCTVCESPAVTAESPGDIVTSGAGRYGEWTLSTAQRVKHNMYIYEGLRTRVD